ncbi:MAG: C25 family cysteine peptidase [Pyrinomonadaceae bacterium]
MSRHSIFRRANVALVTGLFVVALLGFAVTNPGTSPSAAAAGSASGVLTALAVKGQASQVLLRWTASPRPQTVGYNVYRESRGRMSLLNATPVAGPALEFLGSSATYAWWDPTTLGQGSVRYWVDEISIGNEVFRSGPFLPVDGALDQIKLANSMTWGDLDHADTDNGVSTLAAAGPAVPRTSLPVSKNGRARLEAPATALDQQWAIAGGAALKIAVSRDGWQKIPLADMQTAGLPINNPANYRLFTGGIEQPIYANANGSLEFYGRGLNQTSTDTRFYYLVAGSHGARIQQTNLGPFDAGVAAGSYAATVERRDRNTRFGSLINGDGNNFFGPVIFTNPVKQSVPVTDLDTSGPDGMLEVSVQGLTAVSHLVEVRLNGSLLGTIAFNSLGSGVGQFAVPMSLLQNGKNLVTLVGTAPVSDVSLTDYVRLTYTRRNRADKNRLRFNVPAGQAVRLDGFTSNQLKVVDLTDPENPAELLVGTAADGNGGFACTIPSGPARSLLIQTAALASSYQAKLSSNTPSSLNLVSNQADFVIVTPPGWGATAEPLRALRQSQGLNTRIVDVEDVYDEFSFGAHDPVALRDFVNRSSTQWATPVRYVMLIGDAGNDPRDYLGTGGVGVDLMPTKTVDSQFTESPSDNALVDFNDDAIEDISIGRLPAKTIAHADLMIAKILQHETHPAGYTVGRGALMVSDSPVDYDFLAFTMEIRPHLPAAMDMLYVNRADADTATTRAAVIAGINSGRSIVNFMGHGNVTAWTGANILTNADPVNFTNQGNYSVWVQLTCLNGNFTDINSSCLAEEEIRSPNGGAVAVWASSGETFPDGQVNISKKFYDNIFAPAPLRLGDAVRDAKSSTQDVDVRHLAILFGDPTMVLK